MSDPLTAGLNLGSELLNVVGKIVDRMPTYSQKKKEEYHKLRTQYENEKNQVYSLRDDNLVSIYRYSLLRYVSTFKNEISESSIPGMSASGNKQIDS